MPIPKLADHPLSHVRCLFSVFVMYTPQLEVGCSISKPEDASCRADNPCGEFLESATVPVAGTAQSVQPGTTGWTAEDSSSVLHSGFASPYLGPLALYTTGMTLSCTFTPPILPYGRVLTSFSTATATFILLSLQCPFPFVIRHYTGSR
jgi:hypothetical protein